LRIKKEGFPLPIDDLYVLSAIQTDAEQPYTYYSPCNAPYPSSILNFFIYFRNVAHALYICFINSQIKDPLGNSEREAR
jgi:hypothetical protein